MVLVVLSSKSSKVVNSQMFYLVIIIYDQANSTAICNLCYFSLFCNAGFYQKSVLPQCQSVQSCSDTFCVNNVFT